MKRLNDSRMRLVVVGIVVAIVLGGGRTKADFTFGEPVNLGPTVNSSSGDSNPSISADGLSLYFGSSRPGTSGNSDIWVATRSALNAPWGKPVNLGSPVNSGAIEIEPDISADGLELYFEAWGGRLGNVNNNADVWVAKRATITDFWESPVNLVPLVSTTYPDGEPTISFDDLELYFVTGSFGGDSDLFVSTRATSSDDWGIPVQLSQVNPPGAEWSPSISPDGRVLLFGVSPEGSQSQSSTDIWMTIRDTVSRDWNPPIKLESPINSTSRECPGDISADGRTLYFDSQRAGGVGGTDIWQAPIIPIVDFNSNGIVDSADMCIMVDHWGTDNSLCDIGPMPWGDGVVDVQDLIVLAEHLFEEFPTVESVR